jgi:two-component system nitrogen regulation sensor histidine kinase NtrY
LRLVIRLNSFFAGLRDSMPTDPRPPQSDSPGTSGALSDTEKKRRRRDLVLTALVVLSVVAVALVERRIASLPHALPFANSVLFLVLNATSVVLIVLLVYLIGRHFVKLVFERQRGTLGASLNLKFVLALSLVATVPTGVLYFVSSGFITASINAWFGLQMDRALDESRDVANSYYDAWERNALHFASQIAGEITERRLLREENREELASFLQAKQQEYHLGVLQVFPFAESEPLATLVNPEIPTAAFVKRDSPLVAAALDGHSDTMVEAAGAGAGDVVRGAVPILSSDPSRGKEIVGAVVVNHLVPHALAQKVAAIRTAVAEYRAIQPVTGQIAGVYQLVLLLFSLVVVLFALWWGLRMAKGVTGPIRALAEGTEKVARGDLDVVIDEGTDDEIGVLVRSFNQMTHDLREAIAGKERSNVELDRRRRYMEIVLRTVGAGVVSLDAEARINTVNPAALRLLGISPGASVVGSKLEEVLQRPELLDVLRELSAQTRPGVRESVRRQMLVPSGDEVLTLLVTWSLLQDEEGRPLGSVIVFDDYTQEVRAQRMAAWREVARRIAHEIKNPLTPIQLSAQRMKRRFRDRLAGDEEDARVFDECVDTITSHVDGLKLLVNEFSQFARLPTVKPRPDDLNQLVQEAVSAYAGTEGVAFQAELDASLPAVELDREQLRRVLTNLLDNARTAAMDCGRPGEVVVRTVYDAPLATARLEVADNGVGIRPEDRRRVFEPYYSTKPHGTGLGLAIASRIVADHHGYVRVHPNRPHGTRFIVELPVRVG